MRRSNVITSWTPVKIFEPRKGGVIEKFTKLHNNVFQYLCSLHTVIGTMK
jgi:hypothetical protein